MCSTMHRVPALGLQRYCLLVLSSIFICLTVLAAVGKGQEEDSSPAALRLYQAAANAQNTGSYRFAVGEWEKLIKNHAKDPLVPKARYYLGICRLQVKDLAGAESAFTELIAKSPKFEMMEETLLNLGWCQYSIGQAGPKEKLVAAAETFKQLLAKYPRGSRANEAIYFRGEALYAVGDTAAAVTAYEQLITKFPESNLVGDATYALGVAQQEQGNQAQAIEVYDQFLGQFKTHMLVTEVRMRKGEVLLAQGNPADAAKLLEVVSRVQDFELADYALFRLAFAISEQEEFARAAGVYASLPVRFPKSAYVPQASMSVGRCWYRAAQWDKAEAALLTHAKNKNDPFYVEAVHWLARIRIQQKKPQEAQQLAAAAIAASGDNQVNFLDQVMLDLADALYAMPDNRNEAMQQYLRLVDKLPESPQAPQALYNATFLALELGQMNQVDALATRFGKAYPEDDLAADVQVVRAESLSQSQKYPAAETAFRKIIEGFAKHPEANNWRLRLAFNLFLQSKYGETVDLVTTFLSDLQGEQAAEAHFLLGLCHFNTKALDKARASFSAAVAASETWHRKSEAELYIGRSYLNMGKTDEAAKSLREFLKSSPQAELASQANHWLGESLYAAGQYPDAAAAYKKVALLDAKSPHLSFALYGEAWSYLKAGQAKEAVLVFTKMIEAGAESPRYDDAMLGRGMARRQSGDAEGALADIDSYLVRNSKADESTDANYERGLALITLKKWTDLVDTFSSLIKDHPDYVNADKVRYELAWAHRSQEDEESAILWFAELASKHSQSPLAAEANFHLAEQQYNAKEFQKALKLYLPAQSELAEREEIREKATYKTAWCWFQLQDYDKSLELFQQQVTKYPKGELRADGLFMQAECHFKLEKFSDALPIYLQVMKLPFSSKNVEALALLHGGQAASQLKKWTDSVTMLSEILTRQPKSSYVPEAHLERGWARQNLNQLENALGDYAITAETAGELGARARFMMGETRFQQKVYADAIQEFQRVMFYYGGDKAPPAVKKWQARAAMEAGRCAELLVTAAKTSRDKQRNINEAKKFYEYVLNHHDDGNNSKQARLRLKELMRF